MYDVIKKPVLTEKSNALESLGKYVFVVDKRSNKGQIKKAVQKIFDVTVKSVNIINIPAKLKVFKGKKGRRSACKKAVITTKNMQKIEFSNGI
jgi:large subunit ribosomal protein L23